ncbi:MAG TPA: hypothetical protein VJY34_28145 [Roseiarcus sp.]|nr:hypothetical protein [Roseiarcus sp.]
MFIMPRISRKTVIVSLVILGGGVALSEWAQRSVTPEQREARAEIEKAQNHFAYAKHVAIEQLRQTMHDPDSLVVEFAGVTEDATTVCMQYRAKNGFGGYDKAIAIDTGGRIASDVSTWNRLCVQRLYDVEGPDA